VGASDHLKGKRVLISGASRGFGEVLAKTFALQGASLALNFRGNRPEIEALKEELKGLGSDVLICKGDVSREEDCGRICREVVSWGGVDVMVCCAFPQAEVQRFCTQRPAEFVDYVQRAVGCSSTLLRPFLEHLRPGAMVVDISSIFVVSPQKGFSHYVAAKSAVEGLMRALAVEHSEIRFVIVRPPRMLTDQTNLAFDLHPPVSAVGVASRIIRSLEEPSGKGNCIELNL
jgi:NAD(P)-dependent dehydrogenase (short-subunit alcohol dehydrogenase family)